MNIGAIFKLAAQTNDYDVEITKDINKDVMKIVFDSYVASGFIQASCKERARPDYEGSGRLTTIIVRKNHKIVGTVGIIEIIDKNGHLYGDVLSKYNDVYEVTNLVATESCLLTLLVLWQGMLRAAKGKAKYLFIEISKNHKRFFKNIFKFEECGSERVSNKDTGDKTIGMMLDLDAAFSGRLYEDENIKEYFKV